MRDFRRVFRVGCKVRKMPVILVKREQRHGLALGRVDINMSSYTFKENVILYGSGQSVTLRGSYKQPTSQIYMVALSLPSAQIKADLPPVPKPRKRSLRPSSKFQKSVSRRELR